MAAVALRRVPVRVKDSLSAKARARTGKRLAGRAIQPNSHAARIHDALLNGCLFYAFDLNGLGLDSTCKSIIADGAQHGGNGLVCCTFRLHTRRLFGRPVQEIEPHQYRPGDPGFDAKKKNNEPAQHPLAPRLIGRIRWSIHSGDGGVYPRVRAYFRAGAGLIILQLLSLTALMLSSGGV